MDISIADIIGGAAIFVNGVFAKKLEKGIRFFRTRPFTEVLIFKFH
jgi:hypothetical protein